MILHRIFLWVNYQGLDRIPYFNKTCNLSYYASSGER